MIRNNHSTETGKYVIHTQQLPAQKRFSDHEFQKFFPVPPASDIRYNFDVIGSLTMEICFGKWWSCSVDTETTVELEFDRINLVNTSNYCGIVASNCITRIDVRNYGQQVVKINPSLKFKKFYPKKTKIHNSMIDVCDWQFSRSHCNCKFRIIHCCCC